MYDGPVIDAFLHGPWIGGPGRVKRADVVPWTDDARLARVMRTFHHEGGEVPRRGAAEVLADMDAAGVESAVLAAKVYYPATEDALESLHAEFAAVSAASGGRLKWIASALPPEHGPGSYWDVMRSSRILQGLGGAAGLIGVHITPSPWALAPNDRWYYPLYAKCVEMNLKLFSYVGMPGPLWPMGPNNPAHLEDVALAFPDLTIIGHHIGDPWTDIAIRLAARHANYYICSSAWSPKAFPRELLEFMGGRWHGTRGSDKVIFASDYPLLDLARTVGAARGLALPAADLQRVLYENARSLLIE